MLRLQLTVVPLRVPSMIQESRASQNAGDAAIFHGNPCSQPPLSRVLMCSGSLIPPWGWEALTGFPLALGVKPLTVYFEVLTAKHLKKIRLKKRQKQPVL